MDKNMQVSRLAILIAAGLSMVASIILWFSGDKQAGLYVGLWVIGILSFGNLMEARRNIK